MNTPTQSPANQPTEKTGADIVREALASVGYTVLLSDAQLQAIFRAVESNKAQLRKESTPPHQAAS